MNILAWNNKIGLRNYFVGLRYEVMINRDSWGYSYFVVRGEILGFPKDELLRKHLPRMFSLIKTASEAGRAQLENLGGNAPNCGL